MRRFLIAAGTRHYRGGLPELPLAHSDVDAVVALFTAAGYERALAAVSADPRAGEFEDALADWCATADLTADDLLVLYYAGHGVRSASGPYRLACTDSEDHRPRSWLSLSSLAEIIAQSPLRNVLLVVDSCHAAAAGAEIAGMTEAIVATRSRADEPGAGTWLLASARHREQARDGAFVRRLAAAWEEGDGPSQRHLSPATLAERINRAFVTAGLTQRAGCSSLDQARRPPFFPNPAFDREAEVTPEGRPGADDGDRASHFDPRGRGVEHVHDPGSYFTGREHALTAVRAHLAGEGGRAPLVVTADPGSGKSAVLGRLVLEGHADTSVNARHQTLEALVGRLAAAADVRAGSPDALLTALAGRERPFRIVLDSLDEAGPGGDKAEARRIAWELLRPLGAVDCVRLVIGSRREMLPHIGDRIPAVDLDQSAYAEDTSTAEYVAKVLADPAGPYGRTPGTARRIADEVARRSGRCFLVARMTATALLRGPLVDTTVPGWAEQLPSDVGGAFEAYLQRLPRERHTAAMALLSAAAFGEGNGLPRRIWVRVAAELSGIPLAESDVDLLLEGDGSYLSHAEVDRTKYFRLYHQELTDHIRNRTLAHRDLQDVHECFVRTLLDTVPGGGRNWARAPEYVRAHLATHAAEAGLLDGLIEDAAFVLAADPASLLPAVRHASRRPLLSMAVERAAYLFGDADPDTDRAALLAYVARAYGEDGLAGAAEALAASVERMRVPRRQLTPHRVVGRYAGDAYSTWSVRKGWRIEDTVLAGGDRVVLALPPQGSEVRLWVIDSPSRSGVLPHPAQVTGLALVPGGAVTLDTVGALRVWDLHEHAVVGEIPDTPYVKLLDAGALRDGTPVAACRDGDEGVAVVDLTTGHVLTSYPGHTAFLCHDPEGAAQLLVGNASDAPDGTVTLHPVEGDGESRTLLTGRHEPVLQHRIRLADGGMAVAVVSGDGSCLLTLLDVRSGEMTETAPAGWDRHLEGGFVRGSSGSPMLVLQGSGGSVTLRLGAEAVEQAEVRIPRSLSMTSFRYQGRLHTAVADFHELCVVDSLTGERVGPSLKGHESAVGLVHVLEAPGSGDPEILAVGNDGTARLWRWPDVLVAGPAEDGTDGAENQPPYSEPDELITGSVARGPLLALATSGFTVVDTGVLDRPADVAPRTALIEDVSGPVSHSAGPDGELHLLAWEYSEFNEGNDEFGTYWSRPGQAVWLGVARDGSTARRARLTDLEGDSAVHGHLLASTRARPGTCVVGFDALRGRIGLYRFPTHAPAWTAIPWEVPGMRDIVRTAAFTLPSGTAVLMVCSRPARPDEISTWLRRPARNGPSPALSGPATGLWDCETGRPVRGAVQPLPFDTLRLVPHHSPRGTRWVACQAPAGQVAVFEPLTGAVFPVRAAQPGVDRDPNRRPRTGRDFDLRWAETAGGAAVLLSVDVDTARDKRALPVTVWDSTAPHTTRQLPVPATRILWTGTTPNGEVLVALGDPQGITLCHLPGGEKVWSTPVPALVTCLAVVPGSPGPDLAVGTQQGVVLIRPRIDAGWRRRLGL
ncbi:caspase family protein [Streptomyces venezuelae]|uniref:caspase family protein n=1 Tax=Streptomyces venezuelae TaxID=54571 RepID=UPI0016804CD1|nr:caspase family protein [Streptomyces venezuelae]